MKLSLNWLQSYIDLSHQSHKEIEEALTLIGFEVESVETYGMPQLDYVQVGEITEIEQHPNADRLSVCKVKVAEDDALKTIVCGAKNFQLSDRVPVALPGAKLPGGFKIKKSKLRGVASEGMMCSSKELGLGESNEGLLILGNRPDIGTPINEVFTDNDTVYDIEVTPNRPDCLSHIGMARELAAYFDLPFEAKCSGAYETQDTEPLLQDVVVQTEACPLYYAYSIRNVSIAPSPEWLQKRLEAVGLRPINNVVDITNFVLMETGQPLHAFDASKIHGSQIIVRKALDKEKICTLDDKERQLTERMLVIADSERPLVVAGVMGSIDAEVDTETQDIVLEAAYFNPSTIRWASRRLALSTDSSYRFERGVDPHQTQNAALRCIELIQEIAGGEVSSNVIQKGELPDSSKPIQISPDRIRQYCGFGPDDDTIKDCLQRLELKIEDTNSAWSITPPTFRRDLERDVDIIEEFIRIYGTDKIPESGVISKALHRNDSPQSQYVDLATDTLCAQQFVECVHYTLRESNEVSTLFGESQSKALELSNPLASDQSHLRPSLLPGLIDALRQNLHHNNPTRRLFESGRVFRNQAGDSDTPEIWELQAISFVAVPNSLEKEWLKREPLDLFHLKNIGLQLLSLSGAKTSNPIFEPIAHQSMWQTKHATSYGHFTNEGFELTLGTLDIKYTRDKDIAMPVLAAELLFDPAFFEKKRKLTKFKPFSSYPCSDRDLAIVTDKWIPAESVRGELEGLAINLAKDQFDVESVAVFDTYEGDGLEAGKKSLALNLRFRSQDRTLTEDEINKVFDAIQVEVERKPEYSIRK